MILYINTDDDIISYGFYFYNGVNFYYLDDYILKEDIPYIKEQAYYEDYLSEELIFMVDCKVHIWMWDFEKEDFKCDECNKYYKRIKNE